MPIREYIVSGGIGWVIALIVLILCVVALFFGSHISTTAILGLIAGVALARLL